MNAPPPTFLQQAAQAQLPQFNVSPIQASMAPPQPLLAAQMPQAQGQEQATPEKKGRKRKGVFDETQLSASEKKARKEQERERKAEEKAAKQKEKERKAAERLEKQASKAREKAAKAEQQAEKRKTSKEMKEKKNQQATTPKKPPTTPALVFKAKIKASLREQNPTASSAEIDQLITAKWKDLPEEERKIYREERDKALAVYYQQCEEKGITVEKKVKPKKKKEKDGGDKGNLKRPTSAFLYFLKDAMAQLKLEYPSGGRKELLNLASQRWGSLTPEKKIPYEEQAKVSQQRYAEAKKALEAQNIRIQDFPQDDDEEDNENGEADNVDAVEHEDDDDEENESDTE